jgi:hemoglobin/transferrin/lactoferrin receptor protein
MKKLFTLWLLICAFLQGSAQVITIQDKETGHPLEMVTIASESPKAFSVTNARGEADISAFKGAELIQIRILGYKTENKSYAELELSGFLIFLTPSGITMDEYIVSATRWAQYSKDIPSKITTISAKEIELQNPQTAADLLGASGEVFIQKSQQGGGSPMIRGFSTNRLLYTVDGVRMNTAIFRSGNLQNVISLDPFATEKAEVLFGPGSVIYGSDAIGGVMSFQTLTPQFALSDKSFLSGKAVTRYSSANQEKTAHFDLNIGWKKWATVLSFSSNDFNDLRMGSHGPVNYLRPFYVQRQDSMDVVVTNNDPRIQRPSGYTQMNMMQKIRFRPNEKWDFQYGFHYSETSDYARYDRHIRYKNGLPRYGEWSYGPQKWLMNNLNIFHNGDSILYDQLTIRLAQQSFEESRIDRNINQDERHTRIEEVEALSINFDFNKSMGKKHKLFYGMEAVKNDVVSTGIDEDISTGIKSPGPSRYPQSTWESYAAYLSYQYRHSDKFLMQTGARYNQFMLNAEFDTTFYPFPYTTAEINSSALTGSLGFVFRPTESWVLSLNGATGFRSPNVDDIGKVFDSEPGAVLVPNPELEAEYAYNLEFGLAKIFDETVKIDFTGYYTILQNAMVRREFTFNGQDSILYDGELSQVQAVQNAAVARVYGIQTGIEIKLPSGFGFLSRFNLQFGEEEVDDGTISPSRHAAPWTGVSRLTYSVRKLNLQFSAIYSGEKKYEDLPQEEQGKTEIYAVDINGNPWSPGWYTLNFKATYQLSNNFSLSTGIENITDQRYRPYSSGLTAPGRNLILSFKAAF